MPYRCNGNKVFSEVHIRHLPVGVTFSFSLFISFLPVSQLFRESRCFAQPDFWELKERVIHDHYMCVCAFISLMHHRSNCRCIPTVGIMNDLFIAPLVVLAKSAQKGKRGWKRGEEGAQRRDVLA